MPADQWTPILEVLFKMLFGDYVKDITTEQKLIKELFIRAVHKC